MSVRGPRKRLIDRTVDEALEAHCANERVDRHWHEAMRDGVVTMDEALEGVRLAGIALRESHDVVRMAERANQVQKLGLAYIGFGEIAESAIEDAATVGVVPPRFPEAA